MIKVLEFLFCLIVPPNLLEKEIDFLLPLKAFYFSCKRILHKNCLIQNLEYDLTCQNATDISTCVGNSFPESVFFKKVPDYILVICLTLLDTIHLCLLIVSLSHPRLERFLILSL